MSWSFISTSPLGLNNLWEQAFRCDALYECPKDAQGKRLGPLVPYAGKDTEGRNLVGDVYFNFAQIETHPEVVRSFAQTIFTTLKVRDWWMEISTVVGIPEGGRTLGYELARIAEKRFVYPEKVPRPKTPGATKEEYDLVFKRAELSAGERIIVVDDVHNNFNNTDEALESIRKTCAIVVALASALNRSPFVDNIYTPQLGALRGRPLPVISAIRKPLPEYRQDDPEVVADIAAANIEPRVKANWSRLREIMLLDAHRHI